MSHFQGRNVDCLGERVAFHRHRRGWTQEELAAKAGYSQRLVAKAEADGSLSLETIENLAEALSTPERTILPEEFIAGPLALAKTYLHFLITYQRQLVAEGRHLFTDDLVHVTSGDPAVNPLAGEHQTIAGFEGYVEQFFSLFDLHRMDPPEFTTDGEQIVAATRLQIGPKGAPPFNEDGGWMSVRFQFRGRRICRIDDLFQSAAFDMAVHQLSQARDGD